MSYTSHGHWFGTGTPTEPAPTMAKCGGPGMCGVCAHDASPSSEVEQLKDKLRRSQLNHIDSLLGRIDATRSDRALLRRLYTAWWSARIGRAQARKDAADLRTTLGLVGGGLQFVGDRTETVAAELDRFKAAVATMREDHEGCAIGVHDGCQTCIALDTLDKPTESDQT